MKSSSRVGISNPKQNRQDKRPHRHKTILPLGTHQSILTGSLGTYSEGVPKSDQHIRLPDLAPRARTICRPQTPASATPRSNKEWMPRAPWELVVKGQSPLSKPPSLLNLAKGTEGHLHRKLHSPGWGQRYYGSKSTEAESNAPAAPHHTTLPSLPTHTYTVIYSLSVPGGRPVGGTN